MTSAAIFVFKAHGGRPDYQHPALRPQQQESLDRDCTLALHQPTARAHTCTGAPALISLRKHQHYFLSQSISLMALLTHLDKDGDGFERYYRAH